jgi:peroxiredoxin Q/BCP
MAVGKRLATGRRAPDFALPATGGSVVRLSEFKGKKHVVLAFYCLDWTPG